MMGFEHEEPIVTSGFLEPGGLSASPRDGRTVSSIKLLAYVIAGGLPWSPSFSAALGGALRQVCRLRLRCHWFSVVMTTSLPERPGDPNQLVRHGYSRSVSPLPPFDLQGPSLQPVGRLAPVGRHE